MRKQDRTPLAIVTIALFVVLALAACQAAPASTNPPAPPTATPTPTAPPLPDPKTDPRGALSYASKSDLVQSVGFTMDMTMTLQLADENSASALGDVVAAALAAADTSVAGTGVAEIVDSATGKTNMQMTMAVDAAGQQMKIDTVVIGDKAWARVGDGEWTESEVETARSSLPGGMDPFGMEDMLKDAIDVAYIGEEVRDDQTLHHLQFALDPAAIDLGSILGTTGMETDEMDQILQDAMIVGNTWLGVDDLLPRYQDIRMNFILPGLAMGLGDANLRMAMNIAMAFTDINQPVTIEAPGQ